MLNELKYKLAVLVWNIKYSIFQLRLKFYKQKLLTVSHSDPDQRSEMYFNEYVFQMHLKLRKEKEIYNNWYSTARRLKVLWAYNNPHPEWTAFFEYLKIRDKNLDQSDLINQAVTTKP